MSEDFPPITPIVYVSEPEPSGMRWRYRVRTFGAISELERGLNQLGQEGWELVGLWPVEGTLWAVFKQPEGRATDSGSSQGG
jgi:hypothetical protein|nr:MAG: hypothetical protein KatS3mg041_0999 [Bacteroidota bacterium]